MIFHDSVSDVMSSAAGVPPPAGAARALCAVRAARYGTDFFFLVPINSPRRRNSDIKRDPITINFYIRSSIKVKKVKIERTEYSEKEEIR